MDDTKADNSSCDEASASPQPALPPQNPNAQLRRACNACRARKIRCNKESPCSYCIRSKIECIHSDNKPREKRTRILITPQYERKIDLINLRLNGVTELLQDLKINLSPNNGSCKQSNNLSTSAVVASSATTPSSYSVSSQPATGLVEGESSLSAHSVFVNEFLRNVVEADYLETSSSGMRETLNALSHIASASKLQSGASEVAYPYARSNKADTPSQRCELPPIQKAVSLIHLAKSQRLAGTGWIYEFLTMQPFGDLCLNVYFSEGHSQFDSIIVNAGLYSLCWDYAHGSDILLDEKQEYLSYSQVCRENLETRLANLPLHLPTTSTAIAALLFGTFHAISISKPLLCWTLSSKASELCQTLGYHRTTSVKADKPEVLRYKQFLFWSTYYIDKSLSLRLGRASTIPDWDITIDQPSTTDPNEPLLAYFALWIKAARCQGNIYEMLYSPDSMYQSNDTRQSRVQWLVSYLHELEQETQEINDKWIKSAKKTSGEDLMDFYAISDNILRLSLLTNIYRAAPRAVNSPTTFSLDCIGVARATLERHQDCMEVIHRTNGIYFPTYVHWTLLFAPFIPFIVIFCYVIETRDKTDLDRLYTFVGSMQSAPAVSEHAARMHHLFEVLYNIACRYVEFSTPNLQVNQVGAISEMDTHLAALGFPSVRVGCEHSREQQQQQQQDQQASLSQAYGEDLGQEKGHNNNEGAGTDDGMDYEQWPLNPLLWMGNEAQLQDWFTNNQGTMELLQVPDLTFSSHQG